ncbi:MAG: hypothetical protein ABIX01_11885 [Chitinophagaceae bacterium]
MPLSIQVAASSNKEIVSNRYKGTYKVMVDAVKLFFPNLTIEEKEYLETVFHFGAYVDLRSGIEIPFQSRNGIRVSESFIQTIWRRAVYRHLTIEIGYRVWQSVEHWSLRVEGSLQKYMMGGNNSGQFTAGDALTAIDELSNLLKLDPTKARVTRLEIGLNICDLHFNITTWLREDLLRYRSYPFENMRTNTGIQIGKEAVLTHKTVKLYDKGDNILRFELHYNDLNELREGCTNPIYTLADLTETTINEIAELKLLPAFKKIISRDGLKFITGRYPKGLRECERKVLDQFSNQKIIQDYHDGMNAAKEDGNIKEFAKLKKRIQRGKSRFKALVEIHTVTAAHAEIMERLGQLVEISKSGICPFSETRVKAKKGTIRKHKVGTSIPRSYFKELMDSWRKEKESASQIVHNYN